MPNQSTPPQIPNQNDQNNASQPPQHEPKISAWVWWTLLIILLIWNIFVFWPMLGNEPISAEVPYSLFVQQVQDGNVAKVEIEGDQIRGTFKKPVDWTPEQPAWLAQIQPPTVTPATAEEAKQHTNTIQITEFKTIYPSVVGDKELMDLLRANDVEIIAKTPRDPVWLSLLIQWVPLILFFVLLGWMANRGMMGQAGNMFSFGKARARKYEGQATGVTFADVAGAEEAKRELMEVVDYLRNPQKYREIGARIPRGVLLVGPPGTGKTLLAKAVAGEANVPFFSVSASEFVEMFVGVGASRVRDLFAQAKAAAPSIIFIDEIDAVGRRRGAGVGAVNDEREQTLNQLLVEMDGFDASEEVIVLAATNRPDVLDPALLRPGRFDRQVTVGLPDYKGRLEILKIHTRDLKLAEDVDLSIIAAATPGFSGADLANLCNEAALNAARHDRRVITMQDFYEAQDKIILGGARTLLLDEEDRKVIAYHEGGHTIAAWYTPEADPVIKVTIIPRGRALGVTEQLPGKDQYNLSKSYLLARLAVMLGGRTAEEVVFNEITTGAENDLVEATKLARRMVTRWGMSELGLVAFQTDEEQPFLGYELATGRDYSEATAARIDKAIQSLLEERHQYTRDLIQRYRDKLDALAQALLEHETLDATQLEAILGPRPEGARKTPAIPGTQGIPASNTRDQH